MAVVTKAVLKTYFEQGDIPTQGQYVDLIDSQFGLGEAGATQIIQGTISASAAEIEFMSFKKLNLPGLGIDDMKVGTTFIVGKTLEVSGSLRVYDVDNEANLEVVGSITASGNMEAAKYHSIGRNLLRYKANWSASIVGTKDHDTLITGSTIQLGGKIVNGTSTISDCHVTASANISASGVITGNGLAITSNSSLTGSLIVGGNTTFGDGVADTHIFNGSITASNDMSLKNNLKVTGSGYFAGGVVLSHDAWNLETIGWNNGDNIEMSNRKFQLKFTGLPPLDIAGKRYSAEFMTLISPQITANSIILASPSTILNGVSTHIAMHVHNVVVGQAILIPYNVGTGTVDDGGSIVVNFTIL